MTNGDWDEEVDVLVVGSGAGGLTAAIAASEKQGEVLVIEKGSRFGGTTATSGGGLWIPNSRLAKAAGLDDSAEEAFDYIRCQSGAEVPDSLIRAYVSRAPEMLDWLHANTPVRYDSAPYPDYHVEFPGGKHGYRTHLPRNLDGGLLGKDLASLQTYAKATSLFGVMSFRNEELMTLLLRPKGWKRMLAGMVWRYASDLPFRFTSTRDRRLTFGNALIGGLWLALRQRNIPLQLETAFVELVRDGNRISGAVVERQGKRLRIGARKGVILAAGGYERSRTLRERFVPKVADPALSGSQGNDTGDAIAAGEKIGAALRHMDHIWHSPVFKVRGDDRARPCFFERALPGCIIVNRAGERYMNEAASYHIAGREMIERDSPEAGTLPSWIIFDSRFRHKYPMGPLLPLIPDALQQAGVRDMLIKARSIKELAARIDIPASALAQTLDIFNGDARRGVDSAFDRGGAEYDRMYGDPRVQPNPCLAPITKSPFYAMPLWAGDIGTNGGLVTDENAQVMDRSGVPISGLYAVGNSAASVMGGSYPGAGATLGPGMVFGYVAGNHIMD